MKFFAFLLLLAAVHADKVVRYDGYRVLQVGPLKNKEEADLITSMVDNDTRLRQVIMYSEHVTLSAPVEMAVAPDVFDRVQQILDENGIHFIIVDNDLQQSLDATMEESLSKLAAFRDDPTQFAHDAYLRYNDQVAWVNAAASASSLATTFNAGTSYANRNIIGIRINASANRPAIYLDANIHAREWITSSSMLYVIDMILTGTSSDATYLRNNFRFYIIPNLNPDGYEYCWTNDRMWRKTRSPNSGSTCVGTDPNRNWSAFWGNPGASTNPCAEDFRGSAAFSERETRTASDFLRTISSISNLYISVHSYSQMWLLPWGGQSARPSDYTELMRVGNAAAAAIRATNNLVFQVGTVPDLLYPASGGSLDWAKQQNAMAYSYSPELRPATAGQGGFNIPASNIIPSGRELLAAIAAAAREARHKS